MIEKENPAVDEKDVPNNIAIFKTLTGDFTVGLLVSTNSINETIEVSYYTQVEYDDEQRTIWAFPISMPNGGVNPEELNNVRTFIPKGSYMHYSIMPLISKHPFVIKFKEFWNL